MPCHTHSSGMMGVLNASSCAADALLSRLAVVHSFITSSYKHLGCAYVFALWCLAKYSACMCCCLVRRMHVSAC